MSGPRSPVTSAAVLSTPMDPMTNESPAETVGGYLAALVNQVLEHGEGFSGKRPWGNSGWEEDMAIALIKAGVIEDPTLTFDADGYIESGPARESVAKARHLIAQALAETLGA